MPTTIQISDNVKKTLDRMKMLERETYNDIIERMIEDDLEINEQTKKDIEEAKKRIKTGRFVSNEEVKRRLGI